MPNTELIKKAKKLAKEYVSNHYRLNGESYYDHSNNVATVLINSGVKDENIICVAYLHHLDKTKISLDELKKQFNSDIVNLIVNYKKLSDSDVSDINPENINESILIKSYLNLTENPEVLILRLADKVDNIKTAYILPKEKASTVAKRALYLYAPICKLIGLQNYVKVLEDEAFKILNPGEYYQIENYLNENNPQIVRQIEEIVLLVKDILKESKLKFKIDYRIKHIYSVYRKTQKYAQQSKDIKNIYDIAAMRIIVDTIPQAYEVEAALKDVLECLPDERDDYISNPKPSGYQSIHNTFNIDNKIFVEIQIKTQKMHDENEYGLASHTFYKIGQKIKKEMIYNPEILKSISFELNKEKLNLDQFKDYVYVFTPKGDIFEFIKGANLIDYAYHVHKDIGNSCVGGVVNGEFVKLNYILQNGDRVEIKTDSKRKVPSSDWLKTVKTKKARTLIGRALREINQY